MGLYVAGVGTAVATGFLPVVTTAAVLAPIIGRVIDEPRWNKVPQATEGVWANQLAAGYYRVATVEFFTVTSAHGALVTGDATDVVVGAPLKWDLSENAWVDAGDTFTGAFCFHYNATTALECLVGFGQFTGGSGDADCAGLDTVA